MPKRLVSVETAASQLGVITRQIRNLLAAGRLKGEKIGRDWVIYQPSVDAYARNRRSAGRPISRHEK